VEIAARFLDAAREWLPEPLVDRANKSGREEDALYTGRH
jgi:hypothetical protein